MAKGITNGGGLKYKAQLDITEALRNAQSLKRELKDLGITAANGMDAKPLTGYQQAQFALQKTLRDSQGETEKLRQDAARYRAELELGRVAQQNTRNELERLNIVEKDLRISFQQGRITQQQYDTQLAAGRVAQQALNQTLVQGRIEQQNYRTELARVNLARKQEADAARAARREQQATAGSYAEAQKKLRDLGTEIKSTENGFKRLTPELRAKIKEYNELNDALKRFDATMGNHQRNVGNYRGAIQSTAQDLLGFASAYLSAGAALAYVFNQTLAFQRIKTPLTYILGSEGEADKKLSELKKLANDLGLEYFTLANTYRSFSAAARASNFDLGNSEKIFKSVAKASAVLGLSSEQLEGALLAIQQMISKGNVQAEELRGQLAERLPGAFSLAAKAMGVTEAELNKLLQTGQVVASDLLPKLADQLDKAYGDKAKDGITGLNAELNKLYSTLQSFAGEGSFLSKNLFEPIIRGARQVVEQLRQYTRGGGLGFLKDITTFTGGELRGRRNLYDVRDFTKASQSQLDASTATDYTSQNLKELRNSYQSIDAAYKGSVKALLDFNEKSKTANSDTKRETKEQLDNLRKVSEGFKLERQAIGRTLDIVKKTQINSSKEISDAQLTAISDIRKRITQLQKLTGSAIEGSEINNRIKALQERLKSGTAKSNDTQINAQRSLQAEIDSLTKKGREKQLSADAQELADVDAKYKKLREKAIAFNKDPKNKGLKVDAGGLLVAQTKEEDALRDKQNAATLKTTIDQQKKYYEDFEKYKSDFGLEKAKERYGKLINVDQTYLENLKSRQAALLGDDKAKGGDVGGGEFVSKQKKVLEDATTAALQEEQKSTDLLLKEFMTYADKRKNLTEKYNADFAALDANPGAQAERTKRYEKDIKELDAANSTQLESYEKLFEGIEKLSAKSALRLVQTARKQLADQIKSGAIIDPAQIKLINDLFDKTEATIRSGTGQALTDLARQVDDIASSIGGIDSAFGKVLSTLGNVLGQVGNIKKGFLDLKTAQGNESITGQLTAGLGIFGAGLNIFQSIVGFFTKAEQREQQATYARDLQNKQTEALNKALERQIALLDDVYGTDRIRDYSAAINQARENEAKYVSQLAGKYLLTGDKVKDDIITKLNNGETIKNIIGSQYDNYQKLLKSGELKGLPSDIGTLQRLLDEGKLDANTATIVQNLIKAKETAEQLVNNLRAETVGTTLSQIADDFISTLTDGTQDFGKTFEQTIQKSILNGFKGELIRKQLQAFYSQFATLSEDGLSADDIEKLRLAYLTASEKAKKDLEALSKATGIDLTTGTSNDNGSVGTIQRQVTEATASEGNAIARATYDLNKRMLDIFGGVGKSVGDLYAIATNNFAIQQKIEANTFRTANNTDLLNTKLDAIIKNTGQQGSTGYDRGN